MKGIILAGGLGLRLGSLTLTINKHLLPVYDKPMIFYPINTLVSAGIKEIMLVVSGPHSGSFIQILKNGQDFGCRLFYGYQEKPDGGIADALSICKEFVGINNCCVILGDNTTDADISKEIEDFDNSNCGVFDYRPIAHLFLREVSDPRRFGVANIKDGKIIDIEEKPEKPKSNLAVTGLYLYDCNIWNFIKECKPSARGEIEISDCNNLYIKHGEVTYSTLKGYWKDAGTFDSLLEAGNYWKNKNKKGV